jgi:hypothetical protein
MRKLAALLFLMVSALAVSNRCSGGNEVTGPGAGDRSQQATPVSGTHPRPTPNPCRQNPADCD